MINKVKKLLLPLFTFLAGVLGVYTLFRMKRKTAATKRAIDTNLQSKISVLINKENLERSEIDAKIEEFKAREDALREKLVKDAEEFSGAPTADSVARRWLRIKERRDETPQ